MPRSSGFRVMPSLIGARLADVADAAPAVVLSIAEYKFFRLDVELVGLRFQTRHRAGVEIVTYISDAEHA